MGWVLKRAASLCVAHRRRGWPGDGEEFEVPPAMLVPPTKNCSEVF
jgi:hypothetical protein